MSDEVKRPWYRLRPLTVVVGVLVVASLVYLNLLVSHIDISSDFRTFNPGEIGWPIPWGEVLSDELNWIFFPFILWSPAARISEFHLEAFLLSVAIGVSVLVGSLFTVERWCRRLQPKLRFSISFLLVATAWTATVLVVPQLIFTPFWPVSFYAWAILVAYIAIGLTWLAFFDVLGIVFRKRSQSRKE